MGQINEVNAYFGLAFFGCRIRTLTPINEANRRISAKTFSWWLGFWG